MEYVQLGNAGIKVSRLCLGTMNFGRATDADTSAVIIQRALEGGINFFDTANVYTDGESERIVGRALREHRDEVILATKFHWSAKETPNQRGNSRVAIWREVARSLDRLGTDYIDLYQAHRPDPDTPIEETLATLTDLVRQGMVRYIGCSTFPAWRIAQALEVSEQNGYEAFVSEQPPYSLFDRRIETEVLPVCADYNLAVLPWSPLAGGWLAGRYRRGLPPPEDSRAARMNRDLTTPEALHRFEVLDKLELLAQARGVPLSQYALAWLLAQDAVTAPIIGPRTLEHLEDHLKALDFEFPDDDLAKIDALIPPGTGV